MILISNTITEKEQIVPAQRTDMKKSQQFSFSAAHRYRKGLYIC